MNFYDVLAAEKWGGGIPTTNFFDLLFAQSMGGGEQWQTYEGTLPATINANGDDMRQYQIYGNAGGAGDKTENLYNKSNAPMNFEGYVNNTTYTVVESTLGTFSIIVPVEPNVTYTVVKPATSRFRVGLFTSYPYLGDVATAIYGDRNGNGLDYGTSFTFTTSNNTRYILAFIRNYNDTQATNERMKNLTMVLKGSAIPEFYIPYGYKLDISTSDGTNTTTTPIYVGDTPLDKDEYIDYESQKIYRTVNGTLTPTDPPIPLPALPTVDGTTVVDYAGNGTAPEKVYFEYQGGKQP